MKEEEEETGEGGEVVADVQNLTHAPLTEIVDPNQGGEGGETEVQEEESNPITLDGVGPRG